MRKCAALLLFATAAATPFECPSGGRDDAWPTADDAARFLRVLEESRRAADHHAYFAARGADATEARRRHGQEVLQREGNEQVLDDVEGDGVAMVVVGQARFVASDASQRPPAILPRSSRSWRPSRRSRAASAAPRP